jgi:hypothetical protein
VNIEETEKEERGKRVSRTKARIKDEANCSEG